MDPSLDVGVCSICQKDLMSFLADMSILNMPISKLTKEEKVLRTAILQYMKKPLNKRTDNDRQRMNKLLPIRDGQVIVTAPCGHVFHRQCLKKYTINFRLVRTPGLVGCSICRKPVMSSSIVVLDLRASECGKYLDRELRPRQLVFKCENEKKIIAIKDRMLYSQLSSRYKSLCYKIKFAMEELQVAWWEKSFELRTSEADAVSLGKKLERAKRLQTDNSQKLLHFILELEKDATLPQVVIPHLRKIRKSPHLLVKFREDLLKLSRKHKSRWPKLYEKEDIIVDLVELLAKEFSFKLFDKWKEKWISFQLVEATSKQPIGKKETQNMASLHTRLPTPVKIPAVHKCLTTKPCKGDGAAKVDNETLPTKTAHRRHYKRPLKSELVPTSIATLIESQNPEFVEKIFPHDEVRVTTKNSNSNIAVSIHRSGDLSMTIPHKEAKKNVFPSLQTPPPMTNSYYIEPDVTMSWEGQGQDKYNILTESLFEGTEIAKERLQFLVEGIASSPAQAQQSDNPFVVHLQRNRTAILPAPTSARNWNNQLNPETILDIELIPDHAQYFSYTNSSSGTLCPQIGRSIIPNSQSPANELKLPLLENSPSRLRVPTHYQDQIIESNQYIRTDKFGNPRRLDTPSDWLRRIPRPPPMTPAASHLMLDYNAVLALIPIPDNSLGITPHFDLGDLGRIIQKDLAKR